MKLLFLDLEFASCKNGCKICEFGYVLTDENFKVIERSNIIINPNISGSDWDWWALKNILTRTKKEYESHECFRCYYDEIKKIFGKADYIFGHSLNNDAKALNDVCIRYELPLLDFKFYDIKLIYKEYSNTKKDISVSNILSELNINGETNEHDAETDAFNTMIEFKTMLNKLDAGVEDIIYLCSNCLGNSSDYLFSKDKMNNSKKLFACEFKKIAEKYPNRNNNPAVSISDSIVETDLNKRLKLIDLIFQKEYNYTNKISDCSFFVVGQEKGKRDVSCDYNIEVHKKNIKKITISDLSKMLGVKVNEFGEIDEPELIDKNNPMYLALKNALNKKGGTFEDFQ